MLPIGNAMTQLITSGADEAELLKLAKQEGCRTLAEDAFRKVGNGTVMASDAQSAVAMW